MVIIKDPISFIWDKGNKDKNCVSHKISNNEAEEIFFDSNKVFFSDPIHSGQEERWIILGKTKNDKLLFIVFTMRKNAVRIISVRNINQKEIYLYEKTT